MEKSDIWLQGKSELGGPKKHHKCHWSRDTERTLTIRAIPVGSILIPQSKNNASVHGCKRGQPFHRHRQWSRPEPQKCPSQLKQYLPAPPTLGGGVLRDSFTAHRSLFPKYGSVERPQGPSMPQALGFADKKSQRCRQWLSKGKCAEGLGEAVEHPEVAPISTLVYSSNDRERSRSWGVAQGPSSEPRCPAAPTEPASSPPSDVAF